MSKGRYKIQLNSVLAFVMVICLFVLGGFFFDFYYDLNDDVLLKDIVSGAYSGSPNAHSIQMLYPVSLLISLLYRLIPVLPWQGIFLCVCHGISFYLIAKRSLFFTQKMWTKAAILVTEAVLILTIFLWELVVVQYTVTAALLAACACFLVFTQRTDEGLAASVQPDKSPPIFTKTNQEAGLHSKEECTEIIVFLQKNLGAIVLVILSYNIRSEMLLLMSPFIALTGILKWSEEKTVFAKKTIAKYLSLVGVILFGMGLSLVVDMLAYSGADWKEFRDFFDARTQVYDYTWYPEYEEAEEFYRGIGMTPGKVELIDNYNFGLDESIDAEVLWDIAAYADETNVKLPLMQRLKTAAIDYKWRTFHEQDAPYNFLVLTAYGMVAALAFVFKDKSVLWKLPLAAVFRTIPWMYVILANRVPNRISHPLYYIELIILCAWMFSYYQKNDKRLLALCVALLLVSSLIQLPDMWQKLDAEMERRASVNVVMREFDAYAKSHPDNYYYMDVYSTVDFSEKMFEDVDNSRKNYDILGGWASGSPLQKQTTAEYHEDMLSRAELLLLDNFYFVAEEGCDLSFLDDFYRTLGIAITIEPVDEISGLDRAFVVYEVLSNGLVNHE